MRRRGLWLPSACVALLLLPGGAVAGGTVPLVVDAPVPDSVRLALTDLEQALKARGLAPVHRDALPGDRQDGATAVVVGTAGSSSAVDRLLAAHRVALPEAAESLCVRRLRAGRQTILLIAGRDARGLGYALREVARAVELAPEAPEGGEGGDPLAAVVESVETPFLRVRSMTVHLFNADLERDWYDDERFWRRYFTLLARSRYNNFTLTFADQTNYLCPLYAYLVDVPGFPEVRPSGLSDADRRRHLAALRRVAELAREYGIDFTLGIWMQLPVARYAGDVRVGQLPQGQKAADYCAEGLRQVLKACPAIGGVQLRMNAESGVAEDQQAEFYRPLFQAIRDCGRPVRLDLRYKGLRPETTASAVQAGLDVTVSTKFWCEHLGLPYHPTREDPLYRESRYGFGAMLSYPRDYRVVYRLWSVGSQRLLLWGDPGYAARFARSCRLGDGEGFEVFAPLTNKGYGNAPGEWRIFADSSYERGTWEFERYWFFYLAFGRLGYNPEADPQIWRRELRHRFGEAAVEMETAYRRASRILLLITAARLPSASEWSWWPEMDTGDRLPEYMRTQPSDAAQFYAVRSWQRTPRWRCEPWDTTVAGYAEDAVNGRLRAKWTPHQVSRKLHRLAEETLASLERARAKSGNGCGDRPGDTGAAELRATELDLRVLAHLALYHADKTLAATHLALFELTGERGRLPHALRHMQSSAAAWRRIVELTDDVYSDRLVFGTSPANARNDFGHHHSGHWKDRLDEVLEDVAYLEALVEQHGAAAEEFQEFQEFPGESPLSEPPRIEHAPLESARPGSDLAITARVSSGRALDRVLLHYRSLNQTVDWKEIEMARAGDDRYEATVPAAELPARWDFQYYIEALVEGGGGRLWPSWEQGPPYVVIPLVR